MSVQTVQQEFSSPEERLFQLFGMSPADIQDIVMEGVIARSNCTQYHPPTYPGFTHWANTVRGLREKTAGLGWGLADVNNFPVSIHPSGDRKIAVQTGDRETGLRTGSPSNRTPRGPRTAAGVAANEIQLGLNLDIPLPPDFSPEEAQPILWVLLYRFTGKALFFELSLPSSIVGGKIKSWAERIIFDPLDLVGTQVPGDPDDDGSGDATDIDVPVERLN